jgi:transposase
MRCVPAPVVGSDETSARVGGKNWWQWVLLSSTAICHVIADTRAASVVTTFLQGVQPEVWVADRYGGQLGHGAVRQMCLAHYADLLIMPTVGWEPTPVAVIAGMGSA